MDYEKLNKIIDESGYHRAFLASKMHMGVNAFSRRTHGKVGWKPSEISEFCKLLNIGKQQRDAIFFSQEVEK